jgi:hypothetical protein
VTRAALAAIALLAPLALGASDPRGDVGPCPPGGPAGGDPRIDILDARGEIVERGTALRFTIRFDDSFESPDGERSPLRVDVVLRDPAAPVVSFRYYRDLNRIVRFDAVADPALQIVLLPEQGANVFVGAVALGDTVTMTLPGRLVTRDADLEGLRLGRLRWGVIARDEAHCDALGDGAPTERLVVGEVAATPTQVPTVTPTVTPPALPTGMVTLSPPGRSRTDDPPGWVTWAILGGAVAAAWIAAFVARRRAARG